LTMDLDITDITGFLIRRESVGRRGTHSHGSTALGLILVRGGRDRFAAGAAGGARGVRL